MKKPNRIAGNGNIAPTSAQSKRRAPAPGKSQRRQFPAILDRTKPLPEKDILAEWENGWGLVEILWQWDDAYHLETRVRFIRDGQGWHKYDAFCQEEPAIATFLRAMLDDPRRNRWEASSRKISRQEAIAWLTKHHGETVIPADFLEDFRPLTRIAELDPEELREDFRYLLRMALKTEGDDLGSLRMSGAIANVGSALGFLEEAQLAATLRNGKLATNVALARLTDLLAP